MVPAAIICYFNNNIILYYGFDIKLYLYRFTK